MKKIIMMLMLLPMLLKANESMEFVLESQGIVIDELIKLGDINKKTGQELLKEVNVMVRDKLMEAYVKTPHESAEGQIIMKAIANIMKNPSPPVPLASESVIHEHYIFDEHLTEFEEMRNNNDMYSSLGDSDLHAILHKNHITLAREYAIRECNLLTRNRAYPAIPRYLGPPSLVNALDGKVNSNVDYMINLGVDFICMTSNPSGSTANQ